VPSGVSEQQADLPAMRVSNVTTDERAALVRAAREWGYFSGAIKSRKDLWRGRRILDIGMGGGPHSISFIEGGAEAYVGVDPLVGTDHVRDFRNLKDPSIPAYHAFDFTTQDIMRIYANIKLYKGLLEDVSAEVRANKVDVAMMAAVTEHLEQPYHVIRAIWESLDRDGLLWISHCNYYSWTGHHRSPRDVASWKRDDPEQAKHVDWRHLEPTHPDYSNRNFNRVRVQDLRDIINKYFEIIEWTVSVEGLARLTPDLRHKWRKYTLDELLGQNIYVTGRRRDVPLGTDLANRPFHHPPETYLADADHSAEPIEPYAFANSVYFSAANELCSHSNNDIAGARVFERLRPGDTITLAKFTNRLPAAVQGIVRASGALPRLRLVQPIGAGHLNGNHDQWTIAEFGPGNAPMMGEPWSPAPAREAAMAPAGGPEKVRLFNVPGETPRLLVPTPKADSLVQVSAIHSTPTALGSPTFGSGPRPGAPLSQAIESASAKYGSEPTLQRLWATLRSPPYESAYTDLQERYREASAVRPDGQLKYLDLPYWIGHKYAIAKKLGLQVGKPVTMLDLGTGAAHMLYVARGLGHAAVGVDGANGVYDDIAAALGVVRFAHPLTRQQPLPDFGVRFDLVTSIWVNYDQWTTNGETHYWQPEDWAFLLNDLVARQLSFPGRIYIELNQQKRPGGGYAYNSDLLEWFESQGALVDRRSGSVDLHVNAQRLYV